MTVSSGVLNGRIGYLDREGTADYMQIYLAPDEDIQAALDWLATDTAFTAIADTQRFSAEIEVFSYVDSALPTGIVLFWVTLCFATDDPTDYGLLDIPALNLEAFIATGCFAGRAIDIQHPAIVAIAALATQHPALITPKGNQYRTLISGGLREVWQDTTRRSG